MPKTVKNIWEKIVNFENILTAFRKVLSNGKSDDFDALRYKANLEENIITLLNALQWKTWVPGPFTTHYIYYPKKRLVEAPCFSDRVLHQAICQVIVPYFDMRFIEDSYACRAGKGEHYASDRLVEMLREQQAKAHGKMFYFLKADISSYYPSINHCILYDKICRVIGDKNVLWLLHTIIFDSGYIDKGLPIGSQTSQLFANIYLNTLDQYVKSELRVKKYIRYMDDIVILSTDKKNLHDIKEHLSQWLLENLHLRWNPKTGIAPVKQGIDFCGYRHFLAYRRPRKRNVKKQRANFKRLTRCYAAGKVSMEYVRSVVASFCGYMRRCSGFATTTSTLKNIVLRRQ